MLKKVVLSTLVIGLVVVAAAVETASGVGIVKPKREGAVSSVPAESAGEPRSLKTQRVALGYSVREGLEVQVGDRASLDDLRDAFLKKNGLRNVRDEEGRLVVCVTNGTVAASARMGHAEMRLGALLDALRSYAGDASRDFSFEERGDLSTSRLKCSFDCGDVHLTSEVVSVAQPGKPDGILNYHSGTITVKVGESRLAQSVESILMKDEDVYDSFHAWGDAKEVVMLLEQNGLKVQILWEGFTAGPCVVGKTLKSGRSLGSERDFAKKVELLSAGSKESGWAYVVLVRIMKAGRAQK